MKIKYHYFKQKVYVYTIATLFHQDMYVNTCNMYHR